MMAFTFPLSLVLGKRILVNNLKLLSSNSRLASDVKRKEVDAGVTSTVIYKPQEKLNDTDELIAVLKTFNLETNVINRNPWLKSIALKSVRDKLALLSKLKVSYDTIPLMKLSKQSVERIVEQWQNDKDIAILGKEYNNRLEYFAKRLNCNVEDILHNIDKHFPILTLDFNKIDRVLHLLLQHGISSNLIRNDLWIIRHNEELIKRRLQKLRQATLPIKPWMLRCPEKVLDIHIEKETSTKVALGSHTDLESYLADRLECSKDEVLDLGKRNPQLLSVNVPKVKMTLDFLYGVGFTPEQVRRSPRVFSVSLETVSNRFEELRELKYNTSNVHILCVTAQQHRSLVLKLTKLKHKQNKKSPLKT